MYYSESDSGLNVEAQEMSDPCHLVHRTGQLLYAKWRCLLLGKVGLRWCGFKCFPGNNGVRIEALTEIKFDVV